MRTFANLEEFVAAKGESLGFSDWHKITQEQVNAFADATGDHQWIHVDVDRAKREMPGGKTIAHGFLTLSLIAPTAFELLMPLVHVKSVVNYGLAKVRFMNAVRSGARVRNSIKLAGVESRGANRYLVTTDNTMEIEGQIRPALTASALAIFLGP